MKQKLKEKTFCAPMVFHSIITQCNNSTKKFNYRFMRNFGYSNLVRVQIVEKLPQIRLSPIYCCL